MGKPLLVADLANVILLTLIAAVTVILLPVTPEVGKGERFRRLMVQQVLPEILVTPALVVEEALMVEAKLVLAVVDKLLLVVWVVVGAVAMLQAAAVQVIPEARQTLLLLTA